jgi:hypothetical protein
MGVQRWCCVRASHESQGQDDVREQAIDNVLSQATVHEVYILLKEV